MAALNASESRPWASGTSLTTSHTVCSKPEASDPIYTRKCDKPEVPCNGYIPAIGRTDDQRPRASRRTLALRRNSR